MLRQGAAIWDGSSGRVLTIAAAQGGDLTQERGAAPIGLGQGEKVGRSRYAMGPVFGRVSGVGVVRRDTIGHIDGVGFGRASHPTGAVPGRRVAEYAALFRPTGLGWGFFLR